MTIGENIRKRRLEYDIEQQELAQRIGVTKTFVNRIESGTKMPSLMLFIAIANVLHCSLDELAERKIS